MRVYNMISRPLYYMNFILILLFTASGIFSQVLLNEVMFNPLGSEHTDEFVEIVNTSADRTVNLTSWQISDGKDSDIIIDTGEGIFLKPRQTGLILDADYFDRSGCYDASIPGDALVLTIHGSTFGSGGFSNSTPETVMLINNNGILIDSVRYDTGTKPGYSYERVRPDGSYPDEDNWKQSRVLNGTPGSGNSVSLPGSDLIVKDFRMDFEIQEGRPEVRLEILLLNASTTVIVQGEITLFTDSDGDSCASGFETIGRESFSSITPGDSNSVYFLWINPQYGPHVVGIEMTFSLCGELKLCHQFFHMTLPYPQGAVVINEIMAHPLPGFPEWIELYNPHDYLVDLNGWSLSDKNTGERYVLSEQSLIMQPGGYLILSEGPHSCFINYESSLAVLPLPGLNNDQDEIFLYDQCGEIVDNVLYDRSWDRETGASLERVRWDGASQDRLNWHVCTGLEGMTPGRRNSVTTGGADQESILLVQPNPFSPDGDGLDEVLMIHYRLPYAYATITMSVYNVQGRKVRDLRRGYESAGEGTAIWDGRDYTGRLAGTGIYIIYLEALDDQSGTMVQNKTTVVLAGGL